MNTVKWMLLALVAFAGAFQVNHSQASAQPYESDWVENTVMPVGALVAATARVAPDGAYAMWAEGTDDMDPSRAPGGDTRLRVRVRCYDSASRDGDYVIRYGGWKLAEGRPVSRAYCSRQFPFASNPEVIVSSDRYAEFWYGED